MDADDLGNACDPIDEAIAATGSGGCSGGAAGSLALVFALVRRRSAHG